MAANDNRWTEVVAEMEQVHPTIKELLLDLVRAAIDLAKQPQCDLYTLQRMLDWTRDELRPVETDLSRLATFDDICADVICAAQAMNRIRKRLGLGLG